MSHLTESVRRHRARILAVVTVVLAAAVGSVVAPQLASARPLPGPTAQITVTTAFSQSFPAGLVTPGVGSSYVVKGQAFDVTFTTNVPLSTTKSTPLVLTITSGPDAGTLSIPYDLPANATSGKILGAVLASAANNVGLKVAVDARKTDVVPGTLNVDVFKTAALVTQGTTLVGFGGGGGPGVPCIPTAVEQQCLDLLLPENGMLSDGLVSEGSCTGFCGNFGTFVSQVLVAVDSSIYNESNPIEVVVKCDKTLCPGKGISTYKVYVELVPGAGATLSPACAVKGVVSPGEQFCTDYVQSKRDGAGDLNLVVELPIDAKIIW
jgi:hypothetical protein